MCLPCALKGRNYHVIYCDISKVITSFGCTFFDNAIYNSSEFKTKECNKGARLPMDRYMETPQATFFLLQYNYRNVQEKPYLKYVNFDWKWLRNLVLCCTWLKVFTKAVIKCHRWTTNLHRWSMVFKTSNYFVVSNIYYE